jgi:hypothetical protein
MRRVDMILFIKLSVILMGSNMFLFSALSEETIELNPVSNISTQIDSIFINFVPPNVPDSIMDNSGIFQGDIFSYLIVCCSVRIDTSGKVITIESSPINYLESNLKSTNFVWNYINRSIDSVSKYWLMKPITYKYFEDDKENIVKPLISHYIILLNLVMPWTDVYIPDQMFWINSRIEK